ncbi:6868_t:CDS:2 [Cetraspora pellucida]|uniref:6868_t:CDS:1 n=1 Tax=Cetraspora pellucida TaxID=1433469 RepID=A0ACA9KE24_9GLOM|nr:6868_t:CDS:2 [Cetraspora pellucida]
MLCYADTIIKAKVVRRSEKENAKVNSVWTIGTYPVGREDNEIEVTLFVLTNPDDRDPESQAIFKRDEYYSIGGKIVPGIYNRKTRPKVLNTLSYYINLKTTSLPESNKCPLKTSLVGVLQEMSIEIEDTENSIIQMLISDYVGQSLDYTVKVVFPHMNPRFKHLKSTIRPQESIIFIIGQIEIIDNEFCIYANDINYIDTNFLTKKKEATSTELSSTNSTRSKLIHIHTTSLKCKRSQETFESEKNTDPVNIIDDNDNNEDQETKNQQETNDQETDDQQETDEQNTDDQQDTENSTQTNKEVNNNNNSKKKTSKHNNRNTCSIKKANRSSDYEYY